MNFEVFLQPPMNGVAQSENDHSQVSHQRKPELTLPHGIASLTKGTAAPENQGLSLAQGLTKKGRIYPPITLLIPWHFVFSVGNKPPDPTCAARSLTPRRHANTAFTTCAASTPVSRTCSPRHRCEKRS